MFYMRDQRCSCGGQLKIRAFRDEQTSQLLTDNAECVRCEKQVILSDEPFFEFVSQYGARTGSIGGDETQ
jgi:hypothetical protein